MRNNNNTSERRNEMMKITEETKTEVTVENVVPISPQIIRILDKKGVCVAFVCVGANSTTVQIGMCQEDKFEVEIEKELV